MHLLPKYVYIRTTGCSQNFCGERAIQNIMFSSNTTFLVIFWQWSTLPKETMNSSILGYKESLSLVSKEVVSFEYICSEHEILSL